MATYTRTAEDDLRAGIAVLESVLMLADAGCFDGRRKYWTAANLRTAIVDQGGNRLSQQDICGQMDKFASRLRYDDDPYRRTPTADGYTSGSLKDALPEIEVELGRMRGLLASRLRPRPLLSDLPDLESLRR